jgi:hypothetical protein
MEFSGPDCISCPPNSSSAGSNSNRADQLSFSSGRSGFQRARFDFGFLKLEFSGLDLSSSASNWNSARSISSRVRSLSFLRESLSSPARQAPGTVTPCYASIVVKSFLQPTSPGNPEDVRRMVAGWQAVEEQEREERRQAGPDAAMAIRGALELMDLFGAMHGWPPPENEARRRDDELARRCWVRVRTFYQAHGQAAKQENP